MKYNTETIKNADDFIKSLENRIERIKQDPATLVKKEDYIKVLEMLKHEAEILKINENKWLLYTAGAQTIIN